MSKIGSMITTRFKSSRKNPEKMSALVSQSSSGNLSSFSGVFHLSPMSEKDSSSLQKLLEKYQTNNATLLEDLKELKAITSEVKAISNQAVLLHGERIKRAQDILKNYQDGAFSAWLIETYGNRQTPYNFLQYHDLYHSLSNELKTIIHNMPRQAIYSLSSRDITQKQKEGFIKEYQGETKAQLLDTLRKTFPLNKKDKRKQNPTYGILSLLEKTRSLCRDPHFKPSSKEKTHIQTLLNEIQSSING